ncbi:hypothetical protein QR680_018413 [Steinernema hermaphroditum]|uniref:ENT domain-containing protein n=1 Tax=Steinernema hermaphroditum TaxID=289476 RepID=A0AA39HHW2_9BILA|nr:hypothetical protein QR680_018413 [Steinernema hermaphroditum]
MMDCQPSSAVNGVSTQQEEDDWGPEDCTYMLRRLEQSALTTLIAAMRAQGGLSEYREKVLNHVKNILHFSDAQMVTEMRRAANDPCLMRISETLNPHYDTFTQWSAAGLNIASNDFDLLPETKREKKPKEEKKEERDESILEFADQLLALANQHNEKVEESKDLARELSELPPVPYVPESMRIMLRSTESDVSQRIALDSKRPKQRKEKAVGPSPFTTPLKRRPSRGDETPATPTIKRRPGRRPKSESICSTTSMAPTPAPAPEPVPVVAPKPEFTTPVKTEVEPIPTVTTTTPEQQLLNGVLHPESEQSFAESPVSGLTQQERIESVVAEVVAGQSPTASHDTSDEAACSRSSLSLLSDDPPFPPEEYFSNTNLIVGGKLQRRKRSKPRDNSTCVCARVQPFIFEPQVPGKPKPPRGNPDRRTAKRPSPTSLTGFSHPSPVLTPGGTLAPPNVVYNGSETPSTSSEAPPSTKTSPSSTTSTYVASSTTKTAHFITPGTYIKRARTVSSGDVSAAIAEGVKSTILRGHAQAAVPKGFVRSTNGTTRLFVAQSPSAAVAGTTVIQTSAFNPSGQRYYGAVPVRASSVSSDGGSSTSSAQQQQPTTTHITTLVTPGSVTVTRVGAAPVTSSPSKGAKSPAHSEGAHPGGGSEQPVVAPATTLGVSVSGATIVKNAILKRSIITRHSGPTTGARILTSGPHPQILRRTQVPVQTGGERIPSSIVVRSAVMGTKPGERRTVTVVPTSLTAPVGTVANPILIRKVDPAVETNLNASEPLKALQPPQEAATSSTTVIPAVERLPPVEPLPECSSSAASTSSEADVAKEVPSEEALKEDSTVEPEAEAPGDEQVEAQEQPEKEREVINMKTVEETKEIEEEEAHPPGIEAPVEAPVHDHLEETERLKAQPTPSRAMEVFEPEAPSDSSSSHSSTIPPESVETEATEAPIEPEVAPEADSATSRTSETREE